MGCKVNRLVILWALAGLAVLLDASAHAGRLLFAETFEGYEEGKPPPKFWKVLEGNAVVENGRLHITSQRQNPRILLQRNFGGDISVSVRLMGAPECHWAGMVVKGIYWVTVNRQFNALLLERRLTHVPSGVPPEDVGKRLASVSGWKKYLWDPYDFVLRVDCQGKVLRVYLDGKLFIERRDEFMPQGGPLMLVGGWGTDIYVDDVVVRRFTRDMLPRRSPPPTTPQQVLEGFEAKLDRQDAIYHDGESATLTVSWSARRSEPLQLRFRLIDFYERTVGFTKVTAKQVAGRRAQVTVELRPPRRGIFKVAMDVVTPDGREIPGGDVISFSVIPKRLGERRDGEDSYFGGHPHWELPEFHYALARKIGMRWARDHDAIQYTWWIRVERERGKWRWYDEEVALLRKNGLHLLGEFLFVPDWATSAPKDADPRTKHTMPPRRMEDFARYVYKTVSHYRGSIRFWEVWNEPHYRGFWKGTAEQYVEMLRAAYEAAKRADPNCVIVGGGGFSLEALDWVERAMRAGMLRYCDIVSFHYGAAGRPLESERRRFVERLNRLRKLMRQYGPEKPIWNTEAAVYTTSFLDQYRYGYSEPDAIYHFREAAYAIVRMFVLNIACGVRKVFYYDVVWPRRDGFIRAFLREPVHTRMLELHGGLKPIGVAYATMADMLEGARFVRTVDLAPDVHAYLFERGGECIAVYWGNFGRRWLEKRIKIERKGDWELSDVMNVRKKLTRSQYIHLPLTRAPMFVIARGTTLGDFVSAWRRAAVLD